MTMLPVRKPSDSLPGSPPGWPAWSTEVRIRHLAQSDLQSLEWEGEYTHFRRLYAESYLRVQAGRALVWVADLSPTGVIGQLFVQLYSERHELADGVNRAYLHSFRVRPPYRGMGVGTRMMRVAEAALARREFLQITLNVSRDNMDAQRLYSRFGYRVEASEPGHWMYLDDKGRMRSVKDPSWRMVKDLR